MSGILAVASREVEERKAWLVASLAFGLAQLALPLVAALEPTRDLIAAGLALAVPLAVAIALGSTIIATDVGERRLGFYFSRPLSGLAIWGGKILGAIVLTAAAIALVAGPVVWANADLPSRISAAVFIAPLFFIFLAHAIASAVRSRSGWLPIDFAALVLLGGLAAYAVDSLERAGAHATLFWAGPWILAGVTLSLLGAGLAQVVIGRSEPRRGHAALSVALWGLVGAGSLGFLGFARWVLGVTPAEVGFWTAEVAPQGDVLRIASTGAWALGGGRARFTPSFWMNAATGAWVRDTSSGAHVFSGDGRRAFWFREEPSALLSVRSDSFPPDTHDATPVAEYGWLVAVSPRGEQVVVEGTDHLRVLESATGRLVGSMRVGFVPVVAFLASGTLRVFESSPRASPETVALKVTDWTPATGESRLARSSAETLLSVEPERGRAIVSDQEQGTLEVVDPGSGGSLSLPAGTTAAVFLGRGSVAALGFDDGKTWVVEVEVDGSAGPRTWLDPFDPRGARIKESAAGVVSIEAGGQFPAWKAPAAGMAFDGLPRGRGVYVVDLGRGRVLRHEADLRFETGRSYWPELASPPGSLRTRLMRDACGALLTADPLTGERRTLVPCGAPFWFLS